MNKRFVYPPIRLHSPIYLSGVYSDSFMKLEIRKYDVGIMAQPRSHLEKHLQKYRVWAADNGCFSQSNNFDSDFWFSWLSQLPKSLIPQRSIISTHRGFVENETIENYGCLFAVAPDVMCDAIATWKRSQPWFEKVRHKGYPVALVAQNGAENFETMWDEEESWDTVFIGGDTDWKLSNAAKETVDRAHSLGKWVHMGRVNSRKRIMLAARWNCDSVDGTMLQFGQDINAKKLHRWLDSLSKPTLFDTKEITK